MVYTYIVSSATKLFDNPGKDEGSGVKAIREDLSKAKVLKNKQSKFNYEITNQHHSIGGFKNVKLTVYLFWAKTP